MPQAGRHNPGIVTCKKRRRYGPNRRAKESVNFWLKGSLKL
jgi:hypothetical protein